MRVLFTTLLFCAHTCTSLAQTLDTEKSALYGKWKYVEATLIESNNVATHVIPQGDFSIFPNGTYEMTRYVGGVGSFPKGKFILKGKTLMLYNSNQLSDTIIYSWSTFKDRHGNSFKALLLKSKSHDGTITIYTLTK